MLLLSSVWNDMLDQSSDIPAIALDITGTVDRIWHEGLLSKLQGMDTRGNLIVLLH